MAIANALQLEAARATPALFRFLVRRRTKFEVAQPYYSVFAADTLLYAVTLTFDIKHLQHIVCDVMKLCT